MMAAEPAAHSDVARELHVTWSDPMEALQMAFSMSRDELLAAFTEPDFPKPPIACVLGFDVSKVEPGKVTLSLVPRELHCNSMGVVAAGVTATVLDAAMWIAVQTAAPDGVLVSTVNVNMHLVRQLPMSAGPVSVHAEAVHVGKTTGTAQARLVDAEDKLYAHATSGLVALTG